MSKTKNKTHSEIEHLRAEIRKLQSENRRLKRTVRDLEKHQDIPPEIYATDDVIHIDLCGSCGKGALIETIIGKFVFIKCDICDFRQRKK